MRTVLIFLACAALAFGATVKLYLKDGTYQLVREYQVQPDRVRFYSTEREQWEEIPLDLVDLNRTKTEAAEHEQRIQTDAKQESEEDAALRAQAQEITIIPIDPGAYYMHDDKPEVMKMAEAKVVTDKRRQVLKVLSPIPMVSGKATLEIDGETARFRVTSDRPEFYFRLGDDEHFDIVKLTPKKDARIVETITIIPITKEVHEEQKPVGTFKKQMSDQLFKIWPEKPLEPGEYALVEYTPVEFTNQSINAKTWDFSVGATSGH